MKINKKTFNEWMVKNYGIQDQQNYYGTQTEEICLKFANDVLKNGVKKTIKK